MVASVKYAHEPSVNFSHFQCAKSALFTDFQFPKYERCLVVNIVDRIDILHIVVLVFLVYYIRYFHSVKAFSMDQDYGILKQAKTLQP